MSLLCVDRLVCFNCQLNSSISKTMLPRSKRSRSKGRSSTHKRRRTKAETSTVLTRKDDLSGRDDSKRSRRTQSPVDWQSENSSSALNTAFIDVETDTVAKWQPDISAILRDDVTKRSRPGCGRKPEVSAVVRQMSLCERKFVDEVGEVICRLSRPLLRRHDILTSQQHSVLFQNLEKVCISGL